MRIRSSLFMITLAIFLEKMQVTFLGAKFWEFKSWLDGILYPEFCKSL